MKSRSISGWRRELVLMRNRRNAVSTDRVFIGSAFVVGVRTRIWAPNRLEIGDGVQMGSDSRFEVDGTIGNASLFGNRVAIVGRRDHDHKAVGVPITEAPSVHTEPELFASPVSIGSDVWVGYGTTILGGVAVGDHAIIGAGSVVSSSIPMNAIAVGVPCRVIGWRFSSDELAAHRTELISQGVVI